MRRSPALPTGAAVQARHGIMLSRQNLANWVIAGALWLEHIFKALHAKLLEQDASLHADDEPYSRGSQGGWQSRSN